jgi:hypothetical protein
MIVCFNSIDSTLDLYMLNCDYEKNCDRSRLWLDQAKLQAHKKENLVRTFRLRGWSRLLGSACAYLLLQFVR